MELHWPQIVYIILLTMDFTLNALRHGEPKKGHYNVGASIVGMIIMLTILYCGGFFG